MTDTHCDSQKDKNLERARAERTEGGKTLPLFSFFLFPALSPPACLPTMSSIPVNSSYVEKISRSFDEARQVTGNDVALPNKIQGKVRDQYHLPNGTIALVTTDRQSGFDRMLASVPYKGAVLNLTSAWWFGQTAHIIPNHVLSTPHPNVTLAKKCVPFKIEFVVRAYVTGSTETSIWTNYKNGCRLYCGHELPEGMVKNQKLWTNLLTPTTKDEKDRPISCEEIVKEGIMSQEDLDYCASKCVEIFAFGQSVASRNGLILVDTKYELGKGPDGQIYLIDEVHTPDSSRYWISASYESRFAAGQEPENVDKEFLRLWFRENCDPYADAVLPEAPKDLVVELARRYVGLFEMITGETFNFEQEGEADIAGRVLGK